MLTNELVNTNDDVVFTEQEIDRFIKQIHNRLTERFQFICQLCKYNCDYQVENLRLFGTEQGILHSDSHYAFTFPQQEEQYMTNEEYNQAKINLLKAYKQHIYGE